MISLADLRSYLSENNLEPQDISDSALVVTVQGNAKLKINVALAIGEHTFRIESFVARNPDENHENVYKWVLEENRRLLNVAFCLDTFGDIYLRGSMPIANITINDVDQLLGVVIAESDRSFNPLLELGFKSAIEREWAWRTSNGMDTANLQAFAHLFNN
ncbi:MAG: hypothetical protein RIR66_705 [Actinomycetota bacterium]|jgi:hypothetical protein